jgi:hypothetical protein
VFGFVHCDIWRSLIFTIPDRVSGGSRPAIFLRQSLNAAADEYLAMSQGTHSCG